MWVGCSRNINNYHYAITKSELRKVSEQVMEEVDITYCSYCQEVKEEKKKIIIEL